MQKISVEDITDKLLRFIPDGLDLKPIVGRLSDLTETAKYQGILQALEAIAGDVRPTTEVFKLAIDYLDAVKLEKKEGEPFAIFSCLKQLSPVAGRIPREKSSLIWYCDAIILGLDPTILKYPDLVKLTVDYFNSQKFITFLNKAVVKYYQDTYQLIHHLSQKYPTRKLPDLLSDLSSEKTQLALKVLQFLEGLKMQIPESLGPWVSALEELNDEWMAKYKAVKNKLSKKMSSAYAVQYVLKHLAVEEMTEANLAILNDVADKMIADEGSPDQWQKLGSCFLLDANVSSTIEKFKKILSVLTIMEEIKDNFRLFVTDFLFNDKSFFEVKNFSLLVKNLSKLPVKMFSKTGVEFYKRIVENLEHEMSEEHIAALNEVISKPQLAFLSDFNELHNNAWLSEAGLSKLALFDERFLSKLGLRFISTFDPSNITVEQIKILNGMSLESVKGENNFDKLVRVRKAQDIIQNLRKLVEQSNKPNASENKPTACESQQDFTNSFLNGEDIYEYVPLISDKREDEPILLVDQETKPLTIDSLNELFCIYEMENVTVICSRVCIQNKIAEQKRILEEDAREIPNDIAGVRTVRKLKLIDPSKIRDVTDKNLQVDVINNRFNLDSDKREDKSTQLKKQIQFLEKLLSYTYFDKIPLELFENNGENLLQLNPGYLENPVRLACLNRIISQVTEINVANLNNVADRLFTAIGESEILLQAVNNLPNDFFRLPECLCVEVFKNIQKLASRYLDTPAMLAYLEKFIKNNKMDDASFVALNTAAEQLFNKFRDCDSILEVINVLPDKCFKLPDFTPSLFSNIAKDWLDPNFIRGITVIDPDLINHENFAQGYSMLDNFDLALQYFSSSVDDSVAKAMFNVDHIVTYLLPHVANPNFKSLLESAWPHIIKLKADDGAEIFLKLKNAGCTDQLFQKLYLYACSQRTTVPTEFFKDLRGQVKAILMPEKKLLESQQEQSSRVLYVKALRIRLEKFCKSKLEFDAKQRKYKVKGGVAGLFLSVDQGPAEVYNALNAITDGEEALVRLYNEIKKQQELKKLVLKEKGDDLEQGTYEFKQAVELAVIKKFITSITPQCTSDASMLRGVLLDDFFYSLLSLLDRKLLINCINAFPNDFHTVMENYRPDELKDLLQIDEIKIALAPALNQSTGLGLLSENGMGEMLPQPATINNNAPTPSSDLELPSENESVVAKQGRTYGGSTPSTTINGTFLQRRWPTTKTIPSKSSPEPVPSVQPCTLPDSASTPADSTPAFIQPVVSSSSSAPPRQRLKAYSPPKPKYQLLDVDIRMAIINILKANLKAEQKDKFGFFETPYSLTEHFDNGASAYNEIDHVVGQHPGKICFGVMNTDRNHYVSVFAFKSSQEAATQVIILDPAWECVEKKNALEKLTKTMRNQRSGWKISFVPDITQQTNGSDCGIRCLQNGLDLIEKELVTIDAEGIKLHKNRLTINAENLKNFEVLAKANRKEWEARLIELKDKQDIAVNRDDEKIQMGKYSFNANKKLQKLITQARNIMSINVATFSISPDLKRIIENGNDIPEDKDKIATAINEHLAKQAMAGFQQICQEAHEIYGEYPSDTPDFNSNTLRDQLLDRIKQLHFEAKYKSFKGHFKRQCKEQDPPLTKATIEQFYSDYINNNDYKCLVEYEKLNFFDHSKYLKSVLKDLNPKSKRHQLVVDFSPHPQDKEAPKSMSQAQNKQQQQGASPANVALPSSVPNPAPLVIPDPKLQTAEVTPVGQPQNQPQSKTMQPHERLTFELEKVMEALRSVDIKNDKDRMIVARFITKCACWKEWAAGADPETSTPNGIGFWKQRKQKVVADGNEKDPIERQKWYIASELAKILHSTKGELVDGKFYQWEQRPIPSAILKPLAELVGVKTDEIIKFNNPNSNDVNVIVDKKRVTRKVQGYDFLIRRIDEKLKSYLDSNPDQPLVDLSELDKAEIKEKRRGFLGLF